MGSYDYKRDIIVLNIIYYYFSLSNIKDSYISNIKGLNTFSGNYAKIYYIIYSSDLS